MSRTGIRFLTLVTNPATFGIEAIIRVDLEHREQLSEKNSLDLDLPDPIPGDGVVRTHLGGSTNHLLSESPGTLQSLVLSSLSAAVDRGVIDDDHAGSTMGTK